MRMHTLFHLCFAILALSPLAAVRGGEIFRAPNGTNTTGLYVIRLSDSVTLQQFETVVESVTAIANETEVYTRVNGSVSNLFTMKLSQEEAEIVRLKTIPSLCYIVNIYCTFIIKVACASRLLHVTGKGL